MAEPALGGLRRVLKAARHLGWQPLALLGLYRLGLRSGYLRWRTPARPLAEFGAKAVFQPLPLPGSAEYSAGLSPLCRRRLLEQAAEIISGQYRPFGGDLQPLSFAAPEALRHWTAYEANPLPAESLPLGDIKLLWEPGRFGWAVILGRAYYFNHDERYAEFFWRQTEAFLAQHPPNLGAHWLSAQEVALRLIALALAGTLFGASPHTTPERQGLLAAALAAHAGRIPPTLGYARAQNNNHLLSEALGLLTAAQTLPEHPAANGWRATGWRWFNHALQTQIASDGAYAQHSANYHRLMLQGGLWGSRLAAWGGTSLPAATLEKLAAATRWLLGLADAESGRLPNFGANDGAYILPLCTCPFPDYRPVLQAAGRVFLGEQPFETGPWDEMSFWLAPGSPANQAASAAPAPTAGRLAHPQGGSWGWLRAAHFTSRPGHADQLHFDLWWRGFNLGRDPGTYLYNAPAPWQNPLTHAAVHNTVTVDGADQMTAAGRFLYLDWAQATRLEDASLPDGSPAQLAAYHDGYLSRYGVRHTRYVAAQPGRRWLVVDDLAAPPDTAPPGAAAGAAGVVRRYRLGWLLPDYPWSVTDFPDGSGAALRLKTPLGWLELHLAVTPAPASGALLQLVRAGECLRGPAPDSPAWGWEALTYAHKQPALALGLIAVSAAPLRFTSEWRLPVSVTGQLSTASACLARPEQAPTI